METEAYCDRLDGQLVAWKAKIYDAIRIVDRLPAAEKELAFSSIRNLHAIVDEIASVGRGDVLVFLSGERDIRETAEMFVEMLSCLQFPKPINLKQKFGCLKVKFSK